MSFQLIPGQEQAKRILINGLTMDKVSHAYIFQGPTGTGKKAAALALAKALLCENGKADGCGECIDCRKVESGNHTSVHLIMPDGASVKIDQIRDLQKQFAYRHTSGGGAQIYIIEEADKMTAAAANSLLKFLEEPGSRIVAVLLTVNGQALLPTIRSRAQMIPFLPLSPFEMAPVLFKEGLSAPLVLPAVRLAAGLSAARELSQLNWFAEVRNVMIQLAKECSVETHVAMLTAQQKLVKSELSEHMDTLFDLFVLWFKDMVHMQWNRKDRIVFIDQTDYITSEAFKRSSGDWVLCMRLAMEARRRLKSHVNAQLAIDHFLISIA
jgi:DNA polymerase III subunit delta'